MDIITAQLLVEGTEEGLRECATDFEGVKCAADKFVKWAMKSWKRRKSVGTVGRLM